MIDPLDDPRERAAVLRAMKQAERASLPAVWRALRRELGTARALAVLLEAGVAIRRGEPFAGLGAASDLREELSRRQAGPLVVLVRAVRRRSGADASMRVGREVARAGALHFLDRMVPPFAPDELAPRALQEAERMLGLFFNADGQVTVGEGMFSIDIRACRFVSLLRRIGEGELAPLMCEADCEFFDGVRRPLALTRTTTLAQGADRCDFVFRVGRG